MSLNDDRTAEISREEKGPEEEEVARAEADVDGVAGGVVDVEGRPAPEGGLEEAVGPPSYTNQEGQDMPPDQATAAVTRGVLTSPQMQGLLGGPSLTPKELQIGALPRQCRPFSLTERSVCFIPEAPFLGKCRTGHDLFICQ